jgi:tetratricopeptide (TPR) repeat protein
MYYKIKYLSNAILTICLITLLLSCKKNWLDAKPDKALVVPSSIKDFQALLDNNSGGYAPSNENQSMSGEIGDDDYYITDATYLNPATTIVQRNLYIWNSDVYGSEKSYGEWSVQYSCIFYANIILEGLEKIIPANNAEQQQWNQAKGSALFFRAYRHYLIAQDYCKPYDQATASTDLGIPLRLQSDFNIKSKRYSVKETYDQIIEDLKKAADILPIDKPSDKLYRLRPTKTAANAMLARVYLSMGDYENALTFSTKTLNLYNTLLDFNLTPPLLPSGFFRFPAFNDEVIFHITGAFYYILGTTRAIVDSELVKSYNPNDRRSDRFLSTIAGAVRFVGNYTGGQSLFTGLATDEVYLIRAECYARIGKKDEALSDLNTLMKKRWRNTVPYPTITAVDAQEALEKVLIERRKELCFRGIRWFDLKRLNRDPKFAKTIRRIINGQLYTLSPNNPKYLLPIPTDVINLTGMEQNPR